jgi:2-keto-4-pentenoate hydratase/2-oxohepta-3-ene-1,7-dioic acid hydratase in catechol pathway
LSQQSITLPIAGSSSSYSVAPTKVIALGLNYRDHIAESESVRVQGFTNDVPEEPVLFPKLPSCLIGPGETIVIPPIVGSYAFEEPRTDYEGELALVIGKECRNVSESEALDVVLGFTCMNDVSQRNIQTGDRSGWWRGKSFDTFGPIGPVLVPVDAIGDVQSLDIETRLNGNVVQSSNTRHMIFSVAETISFISRNFTLYPGDILLTGTPSGVGPLTTGDVVEIEISGIGVLSNPVRDDSGAGE